MTTRKSAAQVLFERLIRTWILPEAARRPASDPAVAQPIPLRMALLVWTKANAPDVYLNEEVFGKVGRIEVGAVGPIRRGDPVTGDKVKGLSNATLRQPHVASPFILLLQGRDARYFVASRNTNAVLGTPDFEALREPLSTEGLVLSDAPTEFRAFFDFIRNSYDPLTPASKKRFTHERAREMVQQFRHQAVDHVRRHLRLPTLMIHADDEFLPLLLEARDTYIRGQFFSCVAASVTTADRVCNHLMERYHVPAKERRRVMNERTFGHKIPWLRARHVISVPQERVLVQMNVIRRRHLHPKSTLRGQTIKRDALKMIQLLHTFLEGTVSVFRDYTVHNGRLVPKPLE